MDGLDLYSIVNVYGRLRDDGMVGRAKIVIAGGGTGGHVLPAISVVDELRRRGFDPEFIWIGSDDGVERDEAARAGIEFRAVRTGKLRRYLDRHTPVDLARIPIGVTESFRILRSFRPDLI